MARQEPEEADRPRASHALTFLFTDLEASTRLWEEQTDAMSGALALHDELLRTAVERNGGRVVKSRGDGTHAVFISAEGAALAACDMQRSIASAAWGATGELHVRIGLHTGVSEERDGDYFGPAVNRAARIMAIANGGQSLASQATAALLRDTAGIDLVDLGEHRLRDLSRPEQVFQLSADGLRTDFPPLHSLNASTTNLPVQLTSFIGRADEMQRLRELVTEHRMVTVTGVGGVGKTRLAQQVAGEMVSRFSDGAWFCELASATDEEAMLGEVGAAFGVTPRTQMTIEDSIIEMLRQKDLLLILDNCEHLLDPVAQLVDRVLRTSKRVRIIATSREALDVDGERPMRLRSMATATSNTLTAVSESDAVQLFVDRASAAGREFALDETNAQTVNTICRRLDGIPLAIELAAVRVVSMSPAEIAARLDERFRLLTGGRRVALERHQTLRAAVEWSYTLLEERERLVFERLAVFAGTFDSAAARAVVTDDNVAEWDVIDALDSLVRKSLVVAGDSRAGSTRYEMLETLRQYAAERLDERGESDLWRERHARHYAQLSDQIEVGMLGRDEMAWRARCELEVDNIRAASSRATDRADVGLVKALIITSYPDTLGSGFKLGSPATRALPLKAQLEPIDRGTLLSIAALEAYARGDVPTARKLYGEAWDTVGDLPTGPDSALLGMWHGFTPDFLPRENQLRAAAELLVTNPGILDEHGWSAAQQSRAYSGVSPFLIQVGHEPELARKCVDLAIELALESGNPTTMSNAYFARASLLAPDDPDAAIEDLEQCFRLADDGVFTGGQGGSRYMSALLILRQGDERAALARLREAIELLTGRGRCPELDGGFGYSIEILNGVGATAEAAVLIGAVLDGVLVSLREMAMPPDRTPPDIRAMRDALGADAFKAGVARGAAMTYEELTTWLLETIDKLLDETKEPA